MEKETGRIEAFSDGVFAIAITLLVLDLHVPPAASIKSNEALLACLSGQWPSFVAFGISFFSIFIMWVNHHKIFKQIYFRNTPVMFVNGVILFMVTITSYPTALLAAYFRGAAAPVAVAIYTGMFVVINLSYNLLWYVAARDKKLLRPDITHEAIRKIQRNYAYGFPAYLLAFLLSFFFPVAALVICVVLWGFWAVSSGKIALPETRHQPLKP